MVDAKVTQIDSKNNKITLSIKSLQIDQEKEAVEQYGSADSGASLGDILGEALNISSEKQEDSDKQATKKTKEAKDDSDSSEQQ
jgi:small subunit ribosomal protein S1